MVRDRQRRRQLARAEVGAAERAPLGARTSARRRVSIIVFSVLGVIAAVAAVWLVMQIIDDADDDGHAARPADHDPVDHPLDPEPHPATLVPSRRKLDPTVEQRHAIADAGELMT